MGEPSNLIAELAARLPVTLPIPTPTSHPHLVLAADLATEEDLLHNPENLRSWLAYAQHVKERIAKTVPEPSSPPSPEQRLLGAFASHEAREGLQQLVLIYERALAVFPTSFKLWKTYINLRQSYVLGEFTEDAKKARAAQAKRGANYKTNVKEVIDGVEEAHSWKGALDGVVGYEEWRSLFATSERMLAWLSHLPVPWLMHLGMVLHPDCPAPFKGAYARRTFDRALRTLPPSLHGRIWGMYLRWAELTGGETGERVWRRFLKVDSSLTERHIAFLLDADPPRALSAAKYLLLIARQSVKNDYLPEDGKSPYQLFIDFLELVERYAGEVGMDEEETIKVQQEAKMSEEEAVVDADKAASNGEANGAGASAAAGAIEPASVQGRLMRIAGPPLPSGQAQIVAPPRSLGSGKVVATQKGSHGRHHGHASGKGTKAPTKPTETYDPDVDPSNLRLLDVEGIVHKDGLSVYKDQAGRLWTGLATYWIKRGEFERATTTFEKGLASVVTVRDFTQIFDAYAEFSETMISTLMEALGDEDNLEDEEFDVEDTEQELDQRMKDFEKLMDRRPFIVNEVLLRRNKDEVVEWEKRIALYSAAAAAQAEEAEEEDAQGQGQEGEDGDAKVIKTYLEAIDAINPRKATGPLYPIYVNFAKFYEEGGTAGQAESNIVEARKIFEKATRVPFKDVDELAEVWCEWAEMELRNENYEEAIRLMQRATTVPKNTKVDYYNDSVSPQSRLFKSLKLWSFYSDLEESIGSVESTKAVYDKIMELKIANAQTIVNYASFLEENKYYEESFKVYERGTELFHFPIAFELWNIYLSKFVKRYGGKKLERARDLFEQSLESCPAKSCKPLFMMYAKLEEEHGLAKRAMGIYDRACSAVQEQDKFDMYTIYIAKATANFGLPATRPIYERALDDLPDRQAATMCRRFAQMERKLGEIDRARALYGHASQFCDPRVVPDFWAEWNSFEIDTGSEDTFREMLRIKRSVQASYNTESSFIAAQTAAAKSAVGTGSGSGADAATGSSGTAAAAAADPMAGLEQEAGGGKASGGGKMRQAGAPSFVASTLKVQNAHGIDEAEEAGEGGGEKNPEAIEIDEDDI